jgi:dolichol-phosphate mannosyltransferase
MEGVAAALEEANIPYEILVVNDNSTDQTESIVRSISRGNPAVRCLNRPAEGFGFGFGFAVRPRRVPR